jgi:hypothetical protein
MTRNHQNRTNMKRLLLTILTIAPALSFGQIDKSISIMDFVQIKNGKRAETIFFYENNWKIYRDIAIERRLIKSYKLLATTKDSTTNFDLILITEYRDSLQFKASEDNFQKIIKETRPTGPKLLNDLKPNDFRQNVFLRQAETLFSGEDKKSKKK